MNRTGSAPGRTINRPKTTFKCRFVPRRKARRTYSLRDAARICCRAIQSGNATFQLIAAEVKSICPEKATEFQGEPIAEQAAMELSISVLEQNNALWEQTLKTLSIINAAILAALIALAVLPIGRFPPLIVVRRGLIGIQSAVKGFQGTVIGRKAANDGVIILFKQQIEAAAKIAA